MFFMNGYATLYFGEMLPIFQMSGALWAMVLPSNIKIRFLHNLPIRLCHSVWFPCAVRIQRLVCIINMWMTYACAALAVKGGLCDSNQSPALLCSYPSCRPGVPLGAKALCGGGVRALAQEQPTDHRQHCPGGILCGGLLLCTLGEPFVWWCF